MKKLIVVVLCLILAFGALTVTSLAERVSNKNVNFTVAYNDIYFNNIYTAQYSPTSTICTVTTKASSAAGLTVRVMAYATGIDGVTYSEDVEQKGVAGTVVASKQLPVPYAQYTRHVGTRNNTSNAALLDTCYVTYE